MTDKEKELLKKTITGRNYLEYGAGKSTEIAREICSSVRTIETDPRWAAKYGAVYVDMGEVGNWGRPIKPPNIVQLKAYLGHAKDYDVMLIDGRYRVGVAYSADPGIIMIHDYDRNQYHVVEKCMRKIGQVDTLALFEKSKPPQVPFEAIIEML